MIRIVVTVIMLVVVVVCVPNDVGADDVRPAFLSIENNKPERFDITWKNPLINGAPLPIAPEFPEEFRRISPVTVIKTPDSIIRKWVLSSEGRSFEGVRVAINGLPSTTSDVLFRAKFIDGRIFREVIRPNNPHVVIQVSEFEDAREVSRWQNALHWIDSSRLLVLLVLTGVLGVLPASRKRGVVLCSVALILGATSGFVAGQVPIADYAAKRSAPTKEETSRILRGLLLNVYRSFSYGNDEAIYDQMAKSVSGELLTDVYLQNRNAMRIEDEEKAEAYVDRLDIRSVESISRKRGGVSVTVGWDVYGSVIHWEHIHYRCNAYKARIGLVRDGKYWKINSFELLDEKRVL